MEKRLSVKDCLIKEYKDIGLKKPEIDLLMQKHEDIKGTVPKNYRHWSFKQAEKFRARFKK